MGKPTITEWWSPLEALAAVFEMEKTVNKCLVNLEALATTKGDFHLASFIQEKFLREQVMDIKMIGDFLTKIMRVGTGLGVHMLDSDLTAFIQTRRQTPLVRAHKKDYFFIEEDVTKISNLGLENLGPYLRRGSLCRTWSISGS